MNLFHKYGTETLNFVEEVKVLKHFMMRNPAQHGKTAVEPLSVKGGDSMEAGPGGGRP